MKMPTMNISRTPDAKLTSLNSAGRISGWRRGRHVDQEKVKSQAGEAPPRR